MASVQTSKYDGRYLKLTVVEESTSIENNTSTVRWTLESIGGNSNYYNVYSVEVKINNVTVYGPTTKTWDSKVFPAAKGSTTGTVTINHNNDGTASPLPFSLRGSIFNNNPQTYSDTLTLSTIPRASSITVSDANIGSSTNIVINKANSSFTTTLYYKASGQSSFTKIVDKTANQVYGWTVPTSFYSLIPNQRNITCQFYAETYSGSTLIGTSSTVTATFTATGNPTIGTRTATDINSITAQLTTGSNTSTTKMVKYASNVQVSVSATAQNSAYISSITVNGSNVSLNGTSTSTTRSGTITFNGATTNTFTIAVTDSRGYTTTNTTSNTLTMINYIPLTINSTIKRNQPTDGQININLSGNYFNGEFKSNVSNTLIVQYRYKESGTSSWEQDWTDGNVNPTITNNTYTYSKTLTNMDYTKSYQFEVRATDEIGTKTITGLTVTKGIPIFNWDNDEFSINVNTYPKGRVYYGQQGSEDYSAAGFIHDQYGNWQHKRSNSEDNWSIKNNSGTQQLTFYPETGILNVVGNIRINGNEVARASNIPTKTSELTNDSIGIDFMTITNSSDQTISGNNTVTKYQLNTTSASNGSKLTFNSSNNSIDIGSGVSYVEISAQIYIYTRGSNSLKDLYIYKNNTQVARFSQPTYYDYQSIAISPKIISVQQGDKITMQFRSSSGSTVLGGSSSNEGSNYLTVKILK